MADESPDQIQTKTWKGQTRYMCPIAWPDGTKCSYDSYSLEDLYDHMAAPHTQDGKPTKLPRRVESPLYDHKGQKIVRQEDFPDRQIPAHLRDLKLKP